MRAVASLWVAVGCVACGDDLHVELPFEAHSGTRLKVVSYVYDDGTRQPDGTQLDDAALHTRCRPGRWAGEVDVERCIPVAEDAVFADRTCTEAVGRRRLLAHPTYFIGHDLIGGESRPVQLFRAGSLLLMPPTLVYDRREGRCVGPVPPAEGDIFYDITGEIAGSELPVVSTAELGAGRIGLRLRTADDGLQVALGFRDRDLDVDCVPADRPEPRVACEPADAAGANAFLDPDCSEPALQIALGQPVPPIARVADGAGCATFHAVGDEVAAPLFQRQGDACVPTPGFGLQSHALGPALELATLERTVEERAGRRLAPVMLRTDGLYVAAEPLHDTATRTTCRRRDLDAFALCLPSTTVTATWRYVAGCVVPVAVADVPRHGCDRVGFATTDGEQGLEIHAVGDTYAGELYDHDELGVCRPYAGTAEVDVRELGPAIPLDAFPAAVAFGER